MLHFCGPGDPAQPRRLFPKPSAPTTFTFVDLFAGIGGFRVALERLGGRCVFSSESDLFAQRTYSAWFGETPAGDIRAIEPAEIPGHDILAAGFPCQPFSAAGLKRGFRDSERGNLFFHLAKIIEAKRPPVVFLENVKNLQAHDGGRTLKAIKDRLADLEYATFHKVYDAANWVPQHRERVFLVGFDKREFGDSPGFAFADPPVGRPKLKEILESKPAAKYTLTPRLWRCLRDHARRQKEKGNGFGFGMADPDGISRTLTARYHKDGSEILIWQKCRPPRRLTPRECARLMGFPKECKVVVSDAQAYRQFGNAVVVPAVEHAARGVVERLHAAKGQK